MQGSDLASERPQGTNPVTQTVKSDRSEFILSPADFRKILIKRKYVILACLLLGIIAAATITYFTVPVYESTARIDIDPSRSANLGISDLLENKMGGGDITSRLQTEVRILQSDSVIAAVIQSEDLYTKPPFSKVFRKSPYVSGKPLTPAQHDLLIEMFRKHLQVLVIPNTDLVEIHYRDPNAEQASKIANAIVDQYLELDLHSRYEGTLRISNWLSGQLNELKARSSEAQRKLAQYQRANNLVGIDAEGNNLVTDSLRIVNQQLIQAEADRIVKEARYKLAQTRNPELLVSVAPTTTLVSLRSQQAELLVQAAQLEAKFGSDYPRVREVKSQLAAVQTDIDAEINNLLKRFQEEYNAAVKTETLLRSRLDETKQEAFRVSDSAADFGILKHEAESTAELYDALQMKLKEAGVTAGLNSNDVNLVDRASVPAFPVEPIKRNNFGFGALIGLFLGISAAIFLETLDDTIRTSDDAEAISHLPSLAVVPRFSSAAKLAKYGQPRSIPPINPNLSSDLVSYLEPHTISAEAFRTLRSSILLSAADNEARVIMITSSFAAEGKSTIGSNLAVSFANRAARVLLVDTDLRRGTLHLKFRIPNRAGLSTILARESGAEAYQTPIADLPNLFVLPRGPVAPNPGEMLASRHMEELLAQWRVDYDHIILDSAPVLPVADALSLAPLVDSSIIVVRAGTTRRKALIRVRSVLRRAQARIMGIVVNDVDLRLENYYTYSKGYGYGANDYGAAYGSAEADE